MKPKAILRSPDFEITLHRLCRQLIENHSGFTDSALIGLQTKGVFLANRIHKMIEEITGNKNILHGNLDITFFRDDFRKQSNPLIASKTDIDFLIENKKVVLIDDVLFTGRTVRAAMDALMQFGRPNNIELLVLIDRRFSRQLPIEATYVGKAVDTIASQKVKVEWKETDKEDIVWLM